MRSRTVIVALALIVVAGPLSAGTIQSTFDTNLEGWTAKGVDYSGLFPVLVNMPGDIAYAGADGNPGGYARLTDAIVDPGSQASAPAKFLGDWTDLIDVGALSFDHKIFDPGPNSGFAPYVVVIASGPITNSLIWQGPTPTGPTDWVHFDIPISSGSFTLSPLASGTFGSILANVTELLLPLELADNDGAQNLEHNGLDNVALTPEPGCLALLAAGALAMGLRWRRR